MDIGNLPDGGVVLDSDQFVVSRGGTARRIQGVRLVRTDISGNALLSGDPIITAGKKLRIGNTPALGGDGGDTTFLYTGDDALVVRNAADSATLFRLSSTGAGAVTGTLNVTGALTQANNQVWHAGNFVPGNYAPLAGAAFTGDVNVAGIIRASTNVLVGGAANPVWHAGNFSPSQYASLAGATFSGVVVGGNANGENFRARGVGQSYSLYNAAGTSRYGYIQHDALDLYFGNEAGGGVRFVFGGGTAATISAGGTINAAGAVAAGTGMTVGGFPVWHQGNFAPSSYASLAGAGFTGTVTAPNISATSGTLSAYPAGGVTSVSAATQLVIGEVSKNSAYSMNVGYWLSSGQWRGTINAIANSVPAPLDLQFSGGLTQIGGAVNAAGAVAAPSFNATGAMAAASMTVGGFGVWHGGNFNPATYAALAGANFSGALQQNGNQVYHSGNLNPALYAPLAGATFTGAIRRDANHYLDMAGAVPVHVFDTNDYIQYDRTNNKFGFVIGGTLVASIDSGGTLRVAGNVIGATAP